MKKLFIVNSKFLFDTISSVSGDIQLGTYTNCELVRMFFRMNENVDIELTTLDNLFADNDINENIYYIVPVIVGENFPLELDESGIVITDIDKFNNILEKFVIRLAEESDITDVDVDDIINKLSLDIDESDSFILMQVNFE